MKELNKVSIWVGNFKSVESFYEFIEYSYDDLTEDLIDSKFGSFLVLGLMMKILLKVHISIT